MQKSEIEVSLFQKVLVILTIFVLVLAWHGQAAYAADPPAAEPAETLDHYVVDDVTYFNVFSENFSKHPEEYLKELMTTKSTFLSGKSMADLWMSTAVALSHHSVSKKDTDNEWYWINATNLMNEVAQSEDGTTITRNLYAKDSPSEFKNWPYQTRKHSMLYMPGLKRAEEWVFEKLAEDGQMNTTKVFENSEEQGPVLVEMVDLLHKGGFLPYGYAGGFNRIVAVYLYDFTAVPILPSDTGNNYVTEIITDTESAPKTVASNARNMTGLSTSASQTVSTSHSVNVTSNINGSRNYSFSESVKTGISYDFLKTLKGGIDITISSSQAVSSGWSKGESVNDSDNSSHTMSVSLPAYTTLMLSQKSSTLEQITRYRCPVGVKYKAAVVIYGANGTTYTFGSDTRQDLQKWAVELPGTTNTFGIDWQYLYGKFTGVKDDVKALASHVPVAPTNASFTEKLETVTSEVSGIAPIEPLMSIKLSAPGVSFISGSGIDYGPYNYLTANMNVGDFSYTDYLELSGYNSHGAAYYGFRKGSGTWQVVDEKGKVMDPEEAPVTVEKDPVMGRTRYTAVKPGKCYLKYRINDNVYATADMMAKDPVQYIKHDDLSGTAVLEVIVKKETEHTWDAGVITEEPDCEKTGVKTYTCKTCGETRTETIKALGHDWTDWEVSVEATETKEGSETRFCRNNSAHTQTRVLPRTTHVHTMKRTKKDPATCTEDGTTAYYTCTACARMFLDEKGEKEIDEADLVLPMTGHRWDEGTVTKEPDCENAGTKTYTCLNCKKTRTEKLKAVGHDWSEWKVTVKATEKKAGEEVRYCMNDHVHMQKRTIVKLTHQHRLVRVKKKAATCSGKGRKAHYKCKECGKFFADSEGKKEIDKSDLVILKKKHLWDDGTIVKEPTCTSTGKKVISCLRCGKTKTVKMKALGHDWSSWQVTKMPTASSAGEKMRYCLNDPSHKDIRKLPKLQEAEQTGEAVSRNSSTGSGGTGESAGTGESSSKADTSRSAENVLFYVYPSKITGSAVTLKWNSVKGADQYVIYGAKCGSKMKQIGVVDSRTLSQKITGIKGDDLKKDTFYKFYVAALANGSNHKSVLLAATSTIHEILKGSGKYANYTSIRLHSAKSIKLKKGKKTTIKAEQVTSSGAGTHAPVHRKVHYLSSNPKVAKVGKTSGKVTAVSAGTCKIYCFTQNGRYKTVSVKVR